MTVQGEVLQTLPVIMHVLCDCFTPFTLLALEEEKKYIYKKKAVAGICVCTEFGGFLRAVYGGLCQSVTASRNRQEVGLPCGAMCIRFGGWEHAVSDSSVALLLCVFSGNAY